MLITSICLTFIVFFLTNLFPNLEKLAKTQGNFRMSEAEVTSFLEDRGYLQPLPIKYGQWLGVLPGYVIEGKDAHAEALSNYFTTDPNWNMYWALPYKAVSKGEEWIIAGQYVTNTSADGEETAVQRMIDAQFVDGLLNWVIVYDKQPPAQD